MAELQDVFVCHGDTYRKSNPYTFEQQKCIDALTKCRTKALGGHIDTCHECGYEHISYNSCRNRHCPKCQGVKGIQWVEARSVDLLEIPYFHVVFTIPSSLHVLFRSNEKQAYNALFRASADTLLECACDRRHLGAKIGFTSVLHTSGQTLSYHPHIHTIVGAGGIDRCRNWKQSKSSFFIPVKVLSALFRGKLLDALKGLPLTIQGRPDPKRIADIIDTAWKTEWVVYVKEPFKSAGCVVEYLGRYTHKTAISNARIVALDNEGVTFKWKDYRDNSKIKMMRLSAHEFIRRFLMHVLPAGFMRIRHYGFLANKGKKKRIEGLRRLRGMRPPEIVVHSGLEIACRLAGRDITKCPKCNADLHPHPLRC